MYLYARAHYTAVSFWAALDCVHFFSLSLQAAFAESVVCGGVVSSIIHTRERDILLLSAADVLTSQWPAGGGRVSLV